MAGFQPRFEEGHGLIELSKQVGLILLAILFYFGVRGLTQGSRETAVDNGLDLLAFEERIGIAWETTMQGWILDSQLLTTLANWGYIWGHWPVIAVTLVWLHHSHRLDYLVLRNAMFLSGAVGLVIFALYPVAPPRLLEVGYLDTVSEYSRSYRVLQPPQLVNKYAAVPSLHVGWNLIVGIAIFRATRLRLLKVLAVLGPLGMALAVIVTANHYVIDGVIGAALSLAALLVSIRITPKLALFRLGPTDFSSPEPASARASSEQIPAEDLPAASPIGTASRQCPA